jgi:hypothetical protein
MFEKIIIISLDTLRSDCISYNPRKLFTQEYKLQNRLETSLFDDICKKSFFFSNAITAAPYTSASHAAYFTGLWPKNNGLYDQFNSKLKAKNLFEIASKNGYRTIFKTDFPFILGKYLNMVKGVGSYFVEDDAGALNALKRSGKSLAFFHFGQIHYPYGFHSLKYGGQNYASKLLSLEKKYNIKNEKINLEDMAIETFRGEEDLNLLYRYKKVISYLYKNALDNDLFDLYIEGINYFHKHKFGPFLDELLSVLGNKKYLLVIMADHGEAWTEETYGHHNSFDEGVLKVPMVFYSPSIIKPKIYDKRVRTVDLLPTLNDLIFKEDARFDGSSLKEIIYENKVEDDRDAFSAVWVNEAHIVLNKIKRILKGGAITTNHSQAVKYSFCYYNSDFKYLKQYKKFINRSERLIEYDKDSLFRIIGDTLVPEKNDGMAEIMEGKGRKLNDIKVQRENILVTNRLKKYFNLQGYNV